MTNRASSSSGSWWTGRYPGWQGEKGESLQDQEDIHNLRVLLGLNPDGPSAWERDNPDRYIHFQCLPENHERGTIAPRKQGSPPGPPIYYRAVEGTAGLVRETLRYNGLLPTDGDNWVIQWSGPTIALMPGQVLKDGQRVNHFPGSTELCRKDKLWSNFASMRKLCGRHAYDFVPESFVLPAQLDEFIEFAGRDKYTWIVKPRSGGQGNGIFLITDPSDLPPKGQFVVSRYIDNPMLIQGLKFDLRIYVLVTSFRPLRVYVYREGLCRFATKAYSMKEEHLDDIYRHLTNYSQNKYASNFVENQDASKDNVGHKWSLSALNRHLRCINVNVNEMWSRIFDIIIKSLIAVQKPVCDGSGSGPALENCFELFGFDVMVDDENKPWLLEVNHSPSMASESPLDWRVKTNVFADALNLVGLPSSCWPWQRVRNSMGSLRQMGRSFSSPFLNTRDADIVGPLLSDAGYFLSSSNTPPAKLSEPHRRAFEKTLSEVQRCRNFIRLAPTKATHRRYIRMAQRAFKGSVGSPEESSLSQMPYHRSGDLDVCRSPKDPSCDKGTGSDDNAEDAAEEKPRSRTPPPPVELPPIMKNSSQNFRSKILSSDLGRFDPGLPFSKGSGRPSDGPSSASMVNSRKISTPIGRPWEHLLMGEAGTGISLNHYVPQQVEILL
eukprot:gnl/MRDRNA2_/MRDRNA2_121241_c0_seq1.p1 gnl/MRDRNA2_/MRDRNA2_121241_c0~~gnl/MRDRNA2_/MRDRNA2_121241_c0_seq1.p1  ORF type:complete len:665 (+),score=89.10 gnl/MRDRNA2_/MRDRNA2_121241_c0_seq1:131-2125(+)